MLTELTGKTTVETNPTFKNGKKTLNNALQFSRKKSTKNMLTLQLLLNVHPHSSLKTVLKNLTIIMTKKLDYPRKSLTFFKR